MAFKDTEEIVFPFLWAHLCGSADWQKCKTTPFFQTNLKVLWKTDNDEVAGSFYLKKEEDNASSQSWFSQTDSLWCNPMIQIHPDKV